MDKSYTSDLTAHLKALEQKETASPRRSRRQEIIKLRTEIKKKKETKKTIQRERTSKLTKSEMKRGA